MGYTFFTIPKLTQREIDLLIEGHNKRERKRKQKQKHADMKSRMRGKRR